MENKLEAVYHLVLPEVKTVYVYPRIHVASKNNPYLSVLYTEYLEQRNRNITIVSPFPLLPLPLLKRVSGEKSIIHCHWLEFSTLFEMGIVILKVALFTLYKLLGGKILWSVHNKTPHARRFERLNRAVYKYMARLSDRLHVHSNEAIAIMASFLGVPADKFSVIEHPLYPVQQVSKKIAQEFLKNTLHLPVDSSQPLFLMYGYIAAYKGIDEIIPLFTDKPFQLVIAGKVKRGQENYFNTIAAGARNSKNIFIKDAFISPEHEKYLFCAADCVVFNLKEILSSGSVMLALSYKKPIIIPNIGCLRDITGPGVYSFDTIEEFGRILNQVVSTYSSQKQ